MENERVDYTHSSRHHINKFARPKVSPTCKCYCYNQQLQAFTASLCKVLCEVWRLLNQASCQHYSGKGVGHNKQSRLIQCGSGVNDIRHRIYNMKDPISLFLNDEGFLTNTCTDPTPVAQMATPLGPRKRCSTKGVLLTMLGKTGVLASSQ